MTGETIENDDEKDTEFLGKQVSFRRNSSMCQSELSLHMGSKTVTLEHKTPFFRTNPLLYHKFGNMVIFGQESYIQFIAQETRIFRKLFIFFDQKGRNRRSKFDNQKYISLMISGFTKVDFELFW